VRRPELFPPGSTANTGGLGPGTGWGGGAANGGGHDEDGTGNPGHAGVAGAAVGGADGNAGGAAPARTDAEDLREAHVLCVQSEHSQVTSQAEHDKLKTNFIENIWSGQTPSQSQQRTGRRL